MQNDQENVLLNCDFAIVLGASMICFFKRTSLPFQDLLKKYRQKTILIHFVNIEILLN